MRFYRGLGLYVEEDRGHSLRRRTAQSPETVSIINLEYYHISFRAGWKGGSGPSRAISNVEEAVDTRTLDYDFSILTGQAAFYV